MKNYSINPNMICERFSDEEIMLYSPTTGEIHILNQISALILSCIKEKQEISLSKVEFIITIKNNYEDYVQEELESDFDEMIRLFIEKNILIELE